MAQVRATDRDIGLNSVLSYYITRGNEDLTFRMDRVTGEIATRPSPPDRERQSFYSLVVTVEDEGNPSLSVSRQNGPFGARVGLGSTVGASLALSVGCERGGKVLGVMFGGLRVQNCCEQIWFRVSFDAWSCRTLPHSCSAGLIPHLQMQKIGASLWGGVLAAPALLTGWVWKDSRHCPPISARGVAGAAAQPQFIHH